MKAEALAEHFGANLVRLRRRAGLSQEALAFRASLHRTQIGKLEHGERLPRIDTLVKLCDALGAEPGELLDGIFWSVPQGSPEGHFVDGKRTWSRPR